MTKKTKDFIWTLLPKFSYKYEKRGDIEIKYTKIFFDFDDHHFKLKFRGNPYPLVEDYICKAVNGDRKFAQMICDTFFSWLQAMADEKKNPFVVVVSKKRQELEAPTQ